MAAQRRRAMITGASSGIGAAFARRLARDGVDLVLVARRRDRLDGLAAELSNVSVEVLVADLGSADGVRAAEARLAADPPVDMLVNNAGFGVYGPLDETDPDALEQMIFLNVTALSRLSVAAAKAMTARGAGTIVNVSSGLAFNIMATNAGYSGTKAYVLNFTRALAMDAGPKGLTVQVLCPGLTRTEFGDRSGMNFDAYPPERVMEADLLVDACLRGLDLGETVCIPSLPDLADLEAFDAARLKIGPNTSRQFPAERYRR